jgi:hypothetical protein
MAYLKPPLLVAKVFNRIAMSTGIGGSETLTVPRRSTGASQSVPVIPCDLDGVRYLVSARGETAWVRNLRAADGRGSLRHRGAAPQPFVATELPIEQRATVIAAYRTKAGRTVDAYFRQLPDPADHPVFALTSPTSVGPAG